MFGSILASTTSITVTEYIVCSLISVVLGTVVALIHCFRNTYSKNLILSLVVIPMVVQSIVMLVNGNVGTAVAVLGAFSLVRFRSQPGNAREITSIFTVMSVGLAMSRGYVGVAAALVVLVGVVSIVLTLLRFGDSTNGMKELRITIPENIDFEGIFDEIFEKYTSKCEMKRVKSTNMGSLFELTYSICEKKGISEKAFIDDLRCRNGNLNISIGRAVTPRDEL